MKKALMVLAVMMITTSVYADIDARNISKEKEVNPRTGGLGIKVTTEYTYPDGTKKIGVTRYSHANYSKAEVDKQVNAHCETITKYYIPANVTAKETKETQKIDEFAISSDGVVGETYTLKALYLPDYDITLETKGSVSEIYQ